MKASNTLVMVQAYRLLVAKMIDNGHCYPLHLGVTEAGDGEDGRIKSAVGIGALLEDGIGDTVRVSLTEEPEFEIPVAKKLVDKYDNASDILELPNIDLQDLPYNPFSYHKRSSESVGNIGGKHVPIVVADLSEKQEIKPINFYSFGYNYSIPLDKWNLQELAADYVYIGSNQLAFEVPGTLGVICSLENYENNYTDKAGFYPIINKEQLSQEFESKTFFLAVDPSDPNVEMYRKFPKAILVADTHYSNWTHILRYFHLNLAKCSINNAVILKKQSSTSDIETFQLNVSSEIGSQLIDGFGDGVWIQAIVPGTVINSTSFGILQATRTRISKTEYISCPSCGRTLFDLQETTAKIRKVTSHLKGVKIGIMGCIVNGPGEMADADYGYVGTGPGKINLYKEKNVVRRNIPEAEAVDALIEIIKEYDDWVEPKID
jgi:(E)-4-hydroxy-3-methylbut-2-enyl-diphosphate synthase